MLTPRRLALVGCLVALAGCGARTGLRLDPPDASVDRPDAVDAPDAFDAFDAPDVPDVADVPDVPDVPPPDVCVTRRYALAPQPAEALFLLDRSQSMNTFLEGSLRRYDALLNALRSTLPAFAASVAMGSMHFPSANIGCDVRLPLAVDVAVGTSSAIIARFGAAGLASGTPTTSALDLARTTLLARPGVNVSRSIVLATDGAPGCNAALDPRVCTCAAPTPPACTARNCLDDVRALEAINRARDGGIAVYVIGIDDPTQPVLIDTLNRMAVAGGRARPEGTGLPRYYSVRRMADLTEALDSVRRSLAACVLRYAGPAADGSRITVVVAGVDRRRDPTRTNGWEWNNDEHTEVALYGDACAAAGPDVPTAAEVRCDVAAPP
jgi:hypothetical protein